MQVKTLLVLVVSAAVPSAAWAQAYDSGDVTSDEQLVLEMINRARVDPTAEGTRLTIPGGITEGFTTNQANGTGPRPPLAMNKKLLLNARAHSRDMYTRNFFAHNNPDGNSPFDRMTLVGYNFTNAAENIAVGSSTTAHTSNVLEDNLMVDTGVVGRGHRTNLLDVADAVTQPAPRREIGIGFYQNAVANGQGWRSFITQDFGRTSAGPFLVGVVFVDTNANNFYDIGEGVPFVNIAVAGGGTAVSSPGGGFVIPVGTTGTITVTATGGPLTVGTTLTQTVTLTGENVRVQFNPTAVQILDTDNDGIPDFWELHYGLDPNNIADGAMDLDGDSVSNLNEYKRGSNPTVLASTPISASGLAAPSFPYTIGAATGGSTGGGGGGGGGGGCGLTGLEGVLLLALLRFRPRQTN